MQVGQRRFFNESVRIHEVLVCFIGKALTITSTNCSVGNLHADARHKTQ
jgi:hypothetical protein